MMRIVFPMIVVALSCFLPTMLSAQVPLVTPGKLTATIVVAESASEAEKKAAHVLQEYLQRMSGVTLPIASDAESIDGPVISVGLTRMVEEPTRKQLQVGRHLFITDPKRDAYVVRATSKLVLLIGHHDDGTLYAVYDLLESLGCRWFFAYDAGQIVPRMDTITVAKVDRVEVPGFAHRFQYAWYGRTEETRNRELAWFDANRLKHRDPVGFSGHNFAVIWPPKDHYETDPEIYPLIDGKRTRPEGGANWQPCLSNPKTIEIAIEWARKTLRAHPEYEIISFAPNDGFGYCECDACAKLGNRADQNIHLANRVVHAVRDEFPQVMVCIWAYADSAVVPTTKVDGYETGTDRALVGLFSVYSKTPFDELVRGWQKASHHLMVSHAWYFTNYHWDLALQPSRYPEILEKYPTLRADGVRLLRLQVMGDWAKIGFERYLAARLMWNPNADVDALKRDFCHKMFPSAPLEFYNFLALYDAVDAKSDDEATFLRRGLCWLDRIREKVRTDEERKRWEFYALYLHSIPYELRFEQAVTNEEKTAVLTELAAYFKGVESRGIFESRRRIVSQCFDKMTKLYGYERRDHTLPEVEPLAIDAATIVNLFAADRAAFPPLSVVIERQPLDWK